MAGIGFELNKILRRTTYLSVFEAYGYAALISSGPWVMSILSLAILGLLLKSISLQEHLDLFFLSVTYVYAASLIFTGPVQMLLTRYAADRNFVGETDKIFPSYISALAVTALFNAISGLIIFLLFVPGPVLFQLSAAFLLVLVSCIWISTIYLTALKNYNSVLFCFIAGYGFSFVFAWLFTSFFGSSKTMFGFALGHLMLFLLMVRCIAQELGNLKVRNFGFLRDLKKYYPLALCGFFYNLGIWIDKIIFWAFSPERLQVSGLLYASPMYDQVVYLSFLTIIPGMAIFLLKLETTFAHRCEDFIQNILRKATLDKIIQAKAEMLAALREGLVLLIKVQGTSTILLVVYADQVLRIFRLGAVQVGVFQITMLGVFLLVLFLSFLTILFYLDKMKDALISCLIFTATNAAITGWSVARGEKWFGFGFMIAAAFGMVAASVYVNHRLKNLEYDIFTSQRYL